MQTLIRAILRGFGWNFGKDLEKSFWRLFK